MADALSQFRDKDADCIRDSAARDYQSAFAGALGHAMKERGAIDGAAFAANIIGEIPDRETLQKAAADYQTGFAAAFGLAMKERGRADGEAAAASHKPDFNKI